MRSGEDFDPNAEWADEWGDPERRPQMVRGLVTHLRYTARGIRDGTTMPVEGLKAIVEFANGARPRRTNGEPVPWEDAPFWPFVGPFYEVAVQWSDAQERGALTPELVDELQGKMYQVALEALGPRGGPTGERQTGRTVGIAVTYEHGVPLPEPRIVQRPC